MFEGAVGWTMLLWTQIEKGTPAARFVMPKDPWPLIFKCRDGVWVQILLGSTGSKYLLYKILEIDDPSVLPNDNGMPKPSGEPKNFFGDIDLLQKHVERRESAELLATIAAAGLPGEAVLAPGACWDDPQVKHNALIVREPDGVRHVGHPVVSRASPAPRKPRAANPTLPLQGIKVIDFGAFVAGPFSSTILSDLGADVIKVEAIGGDPNRSIFRSHTSVNRGKRAISVDLKKPEGLKIARELCLAAEVITNNFRPGVSARLGIDPDTLLGLKPSLIVLESAAYGNTGPRAQGAGFDMCFQALCGHDHRGGGPGNSPLWNRTSMVDFGGGIIGAIAVLQRLYQRARTGEGSFIGASLMNAGLYLMSELIQSANGKFLGAPQVNRSQTGFHPSEQFYEATDGWLAIAARNDAMAGRLLSVLKLTDKVDEHSAAWGEEAAATIATAVRAWNMADLLAALAGADVWAEACCTNGERMNLEDADLLRLGMVFRAEHPQFGEVRQIGPLVRLSDAARPTPLAAVLPGQHTDAVLAELGYAPEAIRALRDGKVVA
jgi:crotonobetainyl-CoA:carnitine CoA-transferase CaiB-like acyl-CoA transferase